MTDIEYAHQQYDIFQTWKDDNDKMLEKLQELNKEYLAESKVYQKNLADEDFVLGLKEGCSYTPSAGMSDNFFLMILLVWMLNGCSNNEPHTENEKIAFLNGKISAYEKMIKESE